MVAAGTAIAGRVGIEVAPVFNGTQRAIGQEMQGIAGKVGPQAGRTLGERIEAGTTKALKVGGVAIGAAVATSVAKGFSRVRAMEDAQAKLAGLGYEAASVEKIMSNVQGALDGTMFLYSEGANVAAGALAAGIKQGDELEGYLRLTADAATQAGIDYNTMGQIMNKVSGQGKLTGDVLNQLNENGVYVAGAMADSFGVTQAEFSKMVSAGEVSGEDFRKVMEEQFAGSSEKAAETMSGAMSLAWTAVGQLGEKLISQVYPYIREFFIGFYDWVQQVAPAVERFGEQAGQAIGDLLGWISNNIGTVKIFAGVIGALAGALTVYTVATRIATGVQALFNTALRMNPIGLVVTAIAALVAGVIWAYNHFEGFRTVIQNVWTAISEVFNILFKGDFSGKLAEVFGIQEDHPLVGFLFTVREGFIEFGRVVADIWTNYVQPAFAALVGFVVETLAPAISNLFTNVIVPAFQGIGNAVSWAWANIIQPAFGALVFYIQNFIVPVVMMLWRQVFLPAFQGIQLAVSVAWTIVSAIFQLWRAFIVNVLGPVFTWLWKNVVVPAFEGLSSAISWVWRNGVKPIFEALGGFIRDHVAPAFQKGIDTVERVWEKLKGIAKAPVKFMIDTVINGGLIGGFNALTKIIPGINPLDPIKVDGFARGGWTGPGSKFQEAGIVHADEFVIRKESQNSISRAVPGLLDALNKYGAKALGYASGGLVRPINGRVTSGFGASRGRYPHAGIDFAAPVGTPVFAAMAGQVMRAGWNVLTGRTGIGAYLQHEGGRQTYYGHLSRLLVQVGDMVRKGQQIALSGNTGRSTGPHLHFETHSGGKPLNPATYLGGAALPEGANVSGGGFNPLQALLDVGSKIGDWFAEKFPAAGMMVDAAKGVGLKAFEDLKEWASSKLSAIGDFAKDVWSNITGSGSVQEQVRKVAEGFGWGDVNGNQWRSLNELIRRESSWNPNAANPSSSARGLFQKMTSIHGPLESTVAGQANWGLNYIRSRYGNPQAAINHHDRRGWYANGGLVEGRDYLFRDQGGNLPPGLNLVLNRTGRDEWIFNQDQLGRLDSAVRGHGGNTYNIHVPHSGASAGDIVRTIEHNSRRLERV